MKSTNENSIMKMFDEVKTMNKEELIENQKKAIETWKNEIVETAQLIAERPKQEELIERIAELREMIQRAEMRIKQA